jgi:beta-glucanase (GH16 family)
MSGFLGGKYVRRSLIGVVAAITALCWLGGPGPGTQAALASHQGLQVRHQIAAGGGPGELAGSRARAGGGLPPGRWALSFDDEFSSPADITSKWGFLGGNSKDHLQWWDPANATVSDGHLVLTADKGYNGHQCWYGPCMYTSAALTTHWHFAQTRGIFEARMRVPVEHGIWPAFWMMSGRPNKVKWSAGEIDILELNGRDPANFAGGFGHTDKVFYRPGCYLGHPIYDAYHTYGIIWTTTGITWTIDGKSCGYMKAYRGWPFRYPFYMFLTLAVGGGWPGPPDASTHFPVRMYVDWVRVYRHV